MKKKIITILTGTMLAASVSFAAPISDLQQNETAIGYNYYNLDFNGATIDNDNLYLENSVSDKFILGIERNSYSIYGANDKTTDIYAQYKLDPNVRLIVGNRDYSDGPSKMFYGIGASTALAPRMDAYASVTTSSISTDWQVGAAYKLNGKASLHLGYKSTKADGGSAADGIGFGVNYTF